MLLLFLSIIHLAYTKCPHNAAQYKEFCYFYVPMLTTWNGAESLCNLQGGHLASIHSLEENNFILTQVMKVKNPVSSDGQYTAIYIGASLVNKNWQWSDGTPYDFDYIDDTQDNPWCCAGSINNNPYCCGTVANIVTVAPAPLVPYLQGHWVATKNGSHFPFICKVPACDENNQSAPSLIQPNQTAPGVVYLQNSDAWFFPSYQKAQSDEIQGEKICSSIGGHLPSVHNAFQNAQLANAMSTVGSAVILYFDFGLRSNVKGTNWHFTDGTNLTYTNWGYGNPMNFTGLLYSYFDPSSGFWFSELDNPLFPHHVGCQFPRNTNFCQ